MKCLCSSCSNLPDFCRCHLLFLCLLLRTDWSKPRCLWYTNPRRRRWIIPVTLRSLVLMSQPGGPGNCAAKRNIDRNVAWHVGIKPRVMTVSGEIGSGMKSVGNITAKESQAFTNRHKILFSFLFYKSANVVGALWLFQMLQGPF